MVEHPSPADTPGARDAPPSTGAPQRLRANKVSHVVATAIVEDIISRSLQPGDRLQAEAAMLERFGVGRASIREGLRLLEAYGVISIRPGQKGGPVVAPVAATDLGRTFSLFLRLSNATYQDVIDARLVIEPVMARLAAERADPEQLEILRRTMDRESESPIDEYRLMSNEFHYTVNGASGNPVLDLMGQALRSMYADRLASGQLFPEEARDGVRDVHQEIGQAILDGDGDLAERLMAEHVSELAKRQAEHTPWLMDERVTWDH